MSDVIIPHGRERVKLQHTACFTPRRVCVCTRVCVRVCLYLHKLCVLPRVSEVCGKHKDRVCGWNKMSSRAVSVLISIITAGCTHTHVAHRHTHTHWCRHTARCSVCLRVMELSSRWIRVWMKISFPALSLSSSGESNPGRGVLDLINLFPYWIGRLPGADQLLPIMHLNDTGSYRVACEVI